MANEAEKVGEKNNLELGEFEKLGGKILERDQNGLPTKWVCGQGDQGQKIDPPGVAIEEIDHYLNSRGDWEGAIRTAKLKEEEEEWSY